MPSTKVVWKFEPNLEISESDARQSRRHDAAEALAGADYRAHQDMVHNEAEGTVTVTRDWPDQSTAEAWVKFVLGDGAFFATVLPD